MFSNLAAIPVTIPTILPTSDPSYYMTSTYTGDNPLPTPG